MAGHSVDDDCGALDRGCIGEDRQHARVVIVDG
jgi:hypothetical protein